MLANFHLADLYYLNGEYRRSQEYYHSALSYEKLGVTGPSWFNLLRLRLASAQAMNHEKDIDFNSLSSYVSQNKIRRAEGLFRRYLSEILLNTDDDHISEAEDLINQAMEAHTNNGLVFELGRDHAVFAEILKRNGDLPGARRKLGQVIDILRKCGADGWVEKYEKELAELKYTV